MRTVLGGPAADMGGDVYAQAKALPAMLLVMLRLLDLSDRQTRQWHLVTDRDRSASRRHAT